MKITRAKYSLITLTVAILVFASNMAFSETAPNTEQQQNINQIKPPNAQQDTRKYYYFIPALDRIEKTVRQLLGVNTETQAKTQREVAGLKAQSDMAYWARALFFVTIGSLIATSFGLWLLWRTLKATQSAVRSSDDAVLTNRQIGEAQVRAYLHCKSAKFRFTKDHIEAILTIENVGQSPAVNVVVHGQATLYEAVGSTKKLIRTVQQKTSTVETREAIPIIAGTTGESFLTIYIWNFRDPDDQRNGWELDPEITEIFDSANEVHFDVEIEWKDVFGNTGTFTAQLTGYLGPGPNAPKNTKSRRSGKLEVIPTNYPDFDQDEERD